jgi:23S rRNA pseudouridine1911/1915/1917 synthase
VLRNGEPVRKSVQVNEGDSIAFDIPDTAHDPVAPAFDLPVLYEDEHLVAIDKPAGLATHGGPGDTAPTVAGWFLARYPAESAAFDAERPGIVHRLDKDTTGVLVLAKTPAAQVALSRAFEQRETVKQYLAVCDGVPHKPRARIEAKIARHPGDRTKMAITRNGRDARTDYEVLGEAHGQSFLSIRLYTGRTHQIRVHLSAISVAVRYDRVYGKPGEGRQLLHAWKLAVPHPSGDVLELTAPLPEDMANEIRLIGLDSLASQYATPVPAELTGTEAVPPVGAGR